MPARTINRRVILAPVGAGAGFFTDDLLRPLSLFTDDLGRRLALFTDDLGRKL